MRKTLDANEVLNEINTSVSLSVRRALFSLQSRQLSEGVSCSVTSVNTNFESECKMPNVQPLMWYSPLIETESQSK